MLNDCSLNQVGLCLKTQDVKSGKSILFNFIRFNIIITHFKLILFVVTPFYIISFPFITFSRLYLIFNIFFFYLMKLFVILSILFSFISSYSIFYAWIRIYLQSHFDSHIHLYSQIPISKRILCNYLIFARGNFSAVFFPLFLGIPQNIYFNNNLSHAFHSIWLHIIRVYYVLINFFQFYFFVLYFILFRLGSFHSILTDIIPFHFIFLLLINFISLQLISFFCISFY